MKLFLYGFAVATLMCGLFFYSVFSNLNQPEDSEPKSVIGSKRNDDSEVLKLNRETLSPASSQVQVAESKTIQSDYYKKQINNQSNNINYNTAQLSEILPSISSGKGILGNNIESFLKSAQFDDVLFSLEKTSDEAYQVQYNVDRVLNDKIKTYSDIYIRTGLNCDDRICLVAVEFDSYDNLNEFSQAVLTTSEKSMAGTSAVIKEGNQKIARIIYNHKKAEFVYSSK